MYPGIVIVNNIVHVQPEYISGAFDVESLKTCGIRTMTLLNVKIRLGLWRDNINEMAL